jgi:membrane protease YdiL (CAAX protease family)
VRGIPVHSPAGTLLVLLGTFAPAIVAVSLTARSEGNAGVRALFGRIVRHPAAVRWFLFAISYFAVIKLSAAVIHRLGWGAWPRFGTEPLALLPFAVALSTPAQAGEELGWRGYALPRLADRIGLAPASLLLGMIWAVWHLPLFFVRGAETFHQSFPAYAAGVVGISVAIAWLYTNSRGGLLLPMLLHAAVNNTKDIVPSVALEAPGVFSIPASRIAWISAAVLWACTIPMLVWMVRTERERRARER